MKGDLHVPFRGSPGVKSPRATRQFLEHDRKLASSQVSEVVTGHFPEFCISLDVGNRHRLSAIPEYPPIRSPRASPLVLA
jgi:hypothetical protein